MSDQHSPREQHGDVFHVELQSTDPPGTRQFFTAVFGWNFTILDAGDYDASVFETPGGGEGHLTPPREGADGPSVTSYVLVDDLDQVRTAIEEAGGTITVPAQEAANGGRYLSFEAPGGLAFVAWQHERL
jgi:predicted enzyme related to lactoylglutathione lyase